MERDLTLDELARRTGEDARTLADWRSRGLIGLEHDQLHGHEDIERVRVIRLLVSRGIPIDDVVRSFHEGSLGMRMAAYLDMLFPGEGRPAYSLEEAAERLGMEPASLGRIWENMFAGTQDQFFTEDDLQGLALANAAMQAGLPEEALNQLMRTWTETLGRAADAASRMVHFYVHEQGERNTHTGLTEFNELSPLLEPSILYFLRKGLLRAVPGDFVLHVEEECGRRPRSDVPGQLQSAIAFVDLAGFTGLTEAMGDVRAAAVLKRYGELVWDAVGHHGGQVTKQLGDGFMVLFHHPRNAVRCMLEIERRVAAENQFPACRAGIHWGSVLYREGDYVGTAVNLSARIASVALRHQVLLSDEARREIGDLPGVSFRRMAGKGVEVKGIASGLTLFAAQLADAADCDKAVDPVCGMELGEGEIAARVTLDGLERAFCSQNCLRRFVADPDAYAPGRR